VNAAAGTRAEARTELSKSVCRSSSRACGCDCSETCSGSTCQHIGALPLFNADFTDAVAGNMTLSAVMIYSMIVGLATDDFVISCLLKDAGERERGHYRDLPPSWNILSYRLPVSDRGFGKANH